MTYSKLFDYVNKSRKEGYSDEEIKDNLLGAGWSEEKVNHVISFNLKKETEKTKRNTKSVSIVFSLIIAVIVFIQFGFNITTIFIVIMISFVASVGNYIYFNYGWVKGQELVASGQETKWQWASLIGKTLAMRFLLIFLAILIPVIIIVIGTAISLYVDKQSKLVAQPVVQQELVTPEIPKQATPPAEFWLSSHSPDGRYIAYIPIIDGGIIECGHKGGPVSEVRIFDTAGNRDIIIVRDLNLGFLLSGWSSDGQWLLLSIGSARKITESDLCLSQYYDGFILYNTLTGESIRKNEEDVGKEEFIKASEEACSVFVSKPGPGAFCLNL